MVFNQTKTTLLTLFLLITFFSSAQKFGFEDYLHDSPNELTVFCVPNNERNENLLLTENILIKYRTTNWIFINATPLWIDNHIKDNSLDDYYFEYAPPSLLADTARAFHFVNEVHSGAAPLNIPYTGKGIIVGIVDQGIDYTHGDFLDINGNTRVLRYWDHTMSNGPSTPLAYGYGQTCDSAMINAGTCPSTENSTAHGTTVAGMATGNGFMNGQNKGIAPDANIIVVESNFNLSNWTLTIADAVDYIFKVADTLGMPAVVNLSLGSYLGSHDGNDPAGEMIESILDAKSGRIVVCAAGNSGNQGKYHQQSTVTSDTNFVWFKNNPSAAFGANTIFIDLWSDLSDATFDFAMAADAPGSYSFRGRTNFILATDALPAVVYDTIWNGSNRIATMEVYSEVVNNNFHLQIFMSNIDSTTYLYRFETTGSGKYDLWSGSWIGLNDMEINLPSSAVMPKIIDYVLPDSLQTTVSSWASSEKVVTVGNFQNRQSHIDLNLTPHPYPNPPGNLSVNSSKGPNRHNYMKPDISASGDVTLTAGPIWMITNSAYNSSTDSNGVHVRNGGTSMASPIVAGIAALYLERCSFGNYADFLNLLHSTAYTDFNTGAVPNTGYGYGKAHAFDLLSATNIPSVPTINYTSGTTIGSSSSVEYQWFLDGSTINGEINQELTPTPPYGSYQVVSVNNEGCTSISNPFEITAGIDDFSKENFVIYPNPFTDIITIETELEITEIILTDLSGKIINFKSLGNNKYNLGNLPIGTYILRISTPNGISQVKISRM